MPRPPDSTGGEGEDFTMNELDLDTRLSVQDYEDAKVTEEGEGTNDAMASDWGWVLILYILITVEMNARFEIVEVQVATGFAQ